jgi:ubiquinone/menaquinone biosynthesis C-methylase UbiE
MAAKAPQKNEARQEEKRRISTFMNKLGLSSSDAKKYYTEEYFKLCGSDKSFKNWEKNKGLVLDARQNVAWKLLGNTRGRILDFGCGRGEIAIRAALEGNEAVGIDYAPEAIKMANIAKGNMPPEARKRVVLVQNKSLKLGFQSNYFDAAFLLNTLDHLSIKEEHSLLIEMKRVLKPGGKLIIRTCTNLDYFEKGYPYYTKFTHGALNLLYKPLFGKEYGPSCKNPRDFYHDSESKVHINEQSCFSLKKLLDDAGFASRIWHSDSHEIVGWKGHMLHLVVRPSILLPRYFAMGMWAVAKKPL